MLKYKRPLFRGIVQIVRTPGWGSGSRRGGTGSPDSSTRRSFYKLLAQGLATFDKLRTFGRKNFKELKNYKETVRRAQL